MRFSKIILPLLALIMLTAITSASLPYTDANKPILITKQVNEFKINLPSTPGTGYSWRLKDYDATVLTPISQTFMAPDTNKPGAPGVESFLFQINQNAFNVKRVSTITFIYVRPWNMDVAKTLTFNVISQ